ncbi:hypothetical protein YC2023_024035 [Brassica napus]
MTNISLSTFIFSILLLISTATAATFEIINQCGYTVWAAASPGGGRRLNSGQSWTLNVPAGTSMARIWGRTNCNFDSSGRGRCETGDCTGGLQCTGWGQPPNTLAEYALNQFNNLDFYDISLVDGFNIPMEFRFTLGDEPKNNSFLYIDNIKIGEPYDFGTAINATSSNCKRILCTADINGQCPNVLRAPGGCNNPCTVFKTNEYCCTNGQGSCSPTGYSKFFKDRCPDAYSYPQDDPTSTFTCSNTNYRVVFCPRARLGATGTDQLPIQMVTEEN